MPTDVITCSNLHFGYGPTPVLQDVNLRIRQGEMVAVVGPNGGGKTTLLKLLLGLLKPDSGDVAVLGLPPNRARHHIGYMPQRPETDPLFPVSVMDVVLMGRIERHRIGSYSARDRTAALGALSELGLQQEADRCFSDLSGGQRQRTLIARALVSDPEVLLLDEPTANVDAQSENRLMDTLLRLRRRMTVILVSHDLGFVSQSVSSVLCVNRQVVFHPTSELTGELIHEIYGSTMRLVRHDQRCAEAGHEECAV